MRRNPRVWNRVTGRGVCYSSTARLSLEHYLSEHGRTKPYRVPRWSGTKILALLALCNPYKVVSL